MQCSRECSIVERDVYTARLSALEYVSISISTAYTAHPRNKSPPLFRALTFAVANGEAISTARSPILTGGASQNTTNSSTVTSTGCTLKVLCRQRIPHASSHFTLSLDYDRISALDISFSLSIPPTNNDNDAAQTVCTGYSSLVQLLCCSQRCRQFKQCHRRTRHRQ